MKRIVAAIAGLIMLVSAQAAWGTTYTWSRPSCSFADTSVDASSYYLPSYIDTTEDYLNNVLVTQDKARTVHRTLNNGFHITHTKQTTYDYWGIGWGENYAYNLDTARSDVSGYVTDC